LTATRWQGYLVRFFFGGLITVIAGLVAKKWGPAVAGLFLAFPAIFPASATLVQSRERDKKQKKGLKGEQRGIDAAAADAMGAALGSGALLAFAAICWRLLPGHSSLLILSCASMVWIGASGSLWVAWKHHRRNR
jgi:Protein of unknown function (DUF3147)